MRGGEDVPPLTGRASVAVGLSHGGVGAAEVDWRRVMLVTAMPASRERIEGMLSM